MARLARGGDRQDISSPLDIHQWMLDNHMLDDDGIGISEEQWAREPAAKGRASTEPK